MLVLVAEDDRPSRLLLSTVLKRAGHEVRVAGDGRAAWSEFQSAEPDVVITDWMMPHVDGLELCRMIRAARRARYPYVVLLTVLGGKGAFLEGMRAGVDDFLTKPFDPDELLARLRAAERLLALHAHVTRLEGLLPICMYCKHIRDDREQWLGIEEYLASRTAASLTHGVCPDCYRREIEPQLSGRSPREP